MAKFQLVTTSTWSGTECYHEIDGDFENEEEALEAFGEDEAWQQALEDHSPEYYVEKVED